MLMDRIIGVFKLDIATFEEIEADQTATGQAALVVLVIALISGLGAGMGASFTQTSFFGSFISSAIVALLSGVGGGPGPEAGAADQLARVTTPFQPGAVQARLPQ